MKVAMAHEEREAAAEPYIFRLVWFLTIVGYVAGFWAVAIAIGVVSGNRLGAAGLAVLALLHAAVGTFALSVKQKRPRAASAAANLLAVPTCASLAFVAFRMIDFDFPLPQEPAQGIVEFVALKPLGHDAEVTLKLAGRRERLIYDCSGTRYFPCPDRSSLKALVADPPHEIEYIAVGPRLAMVRSDERTYVGYWFEQFWHVWRGLGLAVLTAWGTLLMAQTGFRQLKLARAEENA